MGKKRRQHQQENGMSESQQGQQEQQGETPELDIAEAAGQAETPEAQLQEAPEAAPVAPGVEEAETPEAPIEPAAVEVAAVEGEAEPIAQPEEPAAPEAPVEHAAPEVPPVEPSAPAPEAVAAVQPVVPETPAPVQPEETEPSEELQYIEEVRRSGTDLQKIALNSIEAFCAAMKPRVPMTAAQANTAQRDLLSLLLLVLRKDYDDFRKAWSLLLVYFAAHHGDRPTATNYTALSEYSTGRYIDDWADVERAEAFVDLTTLLRVTRKIDTRKDDVKRIRLDKVASGILSDRAKDNLQRFYS